MPSERDPFPYDAEEARVDLELTRQELGETAEALAHKVKQTAHLTERYALLAGAVVGAGVLAMLLIRKLTGK